MDLQNLTGMLDGQGSLLVIPTAKEIDVFVEKLSCSPTLPTVGGYHPHSTMLSGWHEDALASSLIGKEKSVFRG